MLRRDALAAAARSGVTTAGAHDPHATAAEAHGPSPYALLDSGDGAKLERFGDILLHRPSPQCLWRRQLPAGEWARAYGEYVRSSSGGGHWEFRRALPASWNIAWQGLCWKIQPTGFGHVGLFPEQAPFWRWIRERCVGSSGVASTGSAAGGASGVASAAPELVATGAGRMHNVITGAPVPARLEVLNLFAYTGGSSLAAAAGGASVTHCDASRGIVGWASENAQLSQLGAAAIRWIVDDAVKFAQREQRRGHRYGAIILDPPSFGRGAKGEVFKLEDDLPKLLATCRTLLDDQGRFVVLSAHTPGIGPLCLRNLLAECVGGRAGALGCGELLIPEQDGGQPAPRALPSGTWAAWSADGVLPEAERFP
jgi:23S rRNA (cytosine1962-C5)-methyltransferase